MASQLAESDPSPELQAAFRRHLPRRLGTLLRRARSQCRGGWDCNVLRALHDEISLLAGASGRYGMLEVGERLLALEAVLAAPIAARALPDADATAAIDALLDRLRPYLGPALPVLSGPLQRASPGGMHGAFASSEASSTGNAAGADRTGARAQRGTRVCVVNEDDPVVNEMLLQLEQQGCEVQLVESVDGLLEQLPHAPPALAIVVASAATPLDRLAAPLRAVRADPAHTVRLLVVLREPGAELRLRALRAGADHCLALPAPAATLAAAALELVRTGHEAPYRILIVDDDEPQALFAQAILRRAGMETKILAAALPVLDELDRFRPDLLLLDLNMPDCDGFELTELIREREACVNTPIVFLSGELDEDRQFAALEAGADDFLIKPIRPVHLVSAVTNRVRRARAAEARMQRAFGGGSRLHTRARLLDAVAGHLAVAGGRAAHGGLLAIEVEDAATLRARMGQVPFDELLAQVGTFIAGHAGTGCMTARHHDAGFLVFSHSLDEAGLADLARELLAATTEARFGAQAAAVRLVCAVCALDATTRESALALAAVERTLAAARRQSARLTTRSALASAPDALAEELSAALAHDALELVFQPIVPLRRAALRQYQALLRLHAGGREYRAAELVPAALRAGSIEAVDAWVVRRCIALLAARAREGESVRLFVSQSLAAWGDGTRPAVLTGALAAAGVAADALVLEFQAAEAARDPQRLAALGAILQQDGIGLALAGVDAAMAGCAWVERLPLAYVKVAPSPAIESLRDIIAAAHQRGCKVIAACVETAAQADGVRSAGADLLQGNFLRPPARDLVAVTAQAGA